jgi:DNA/RNA-binding domain of Phe-tRNA-synthetase-like protein
MATLGFQYHSEIINRFPGIRGGVILVHGISNGSTPPDLLDAYQAEQRRVIVKIGDTPLSEVSSLAAWRGAFRLFGVDPTKYRSAAEALLRRLTKKGDIPSISTLVDLCNLVSIRYALPVAAFDARMVSGPITVQLASGKEYFTAHDTPEPERPDPGEVIFCDPNCLVVARRWCWKQSVESTVSTETESAIITVEAQHTDGELDIQHAVEDLISLLGQYVRGSYQSGIVKPVQPALTEEGNKCP